MFFLSSGRAEEHSEVVVCKAGVAGLIWRAWIFGASGVLGGWMMRHCIRFKISDQHALPEGWKGWIISEGGGALV